VSISRSDCFQHFGYKDFALDRVQPDYPAGCPIANCSTALVKIPDSRGERPFCPTHGIRLHSKTFVYWNGVEHQHEARLRNFRIRPDLACKIALESVEKAESHRLGYEMSEDALSWNVFVGLAEAGKLRHAVRFLTGSNVDAEPSLYLWGIDVLTGECFPPLHAVRDKLEKGIKRFRTEPDVMLVVDGRLVICVEAKFGSGNPLAYNGKVEDGQKPTDRAGLLRRYLDQATADTRRIINREGIGKEFHSQLFRNVIFASEMAPLMANGCDWHVVNLVSKTQWNNHCDSNQYSFKDPEPYVRSYLHQNFQQCFSFRTWEKLHRDLIKDDVDLGRLNTYICSKSAHYSRAFVLDETAR
jgi:hypothetical protein